MNIKRAHGFVFVQFILLGLLVLALWSLPAASSELSSALGGLMVLSGFILALWAIADFARAARTLPQVSPEAMRGAQLVQAGLYSRVRHPIYSGVLLAVLGSALGHGHWASWVAALALVAFFWTKSRYEESLLRRAYPDYADYMTRTGRFWPRLFS
ncbi:MAG: isoprenylcysteine carboxylmethyltransferase family protein [Anaerolineae bacterium]|nr:isoprenylcysteine carboxylmethyltransferase family protein [Anaerolineae bacterium]MDW8171468.1 isoprenylcysteine carboxylmethyltransferase family protein [Anaerolineae bacterium]